MLNAIGVDVIKQIPFFEITDNQLVGILNKLPLNFSPKTVLIPDS